MFKKSLVALALGTTASLAAVSAHAIPTVMTVTSGSFGMGFFTGGGYIPVQWLGSGAADITDAYNAPGWNTSAAQGPNAGAASAGSIVSFNFGAADVNTYTAAAATQGGVGGGGPAPVFTGTLTNGAFTMDMSSFFANWNGTDFNQGNSSVSGTLSGCSGSGCNFTMSWTSLINGGPFGGNTGSWILNGTIAAVPEASTYGMMAAGLGLVGLAARRRKNKAAR